MIEIIYALCYHLCCTSPQSWMLIHLFSGPTTWKIMVGLCCSCCEVQKQTISSLCQRKSSPNSPQLCDARAKWEVVSLTGVLYLPAEWHRFHLPRCCFVYPPVSSAPECARCLAFHHTQRKERCDWNEAAQTLAYNWFQEPLFVPLLQCYSTPVVEPSLHRSLNIRSTSLWGHCADVTFLRT